MKLNMVVKYALVAFALSAASPGYAEEKIAIGTDGAYAPWSFQDSSGNLVGFDIDIANNLCERMKVSCTIVSQDFDGLIPALLAGKFNALIAAIGITDKRKETIAFSRPYANTKAGFYARDDSALSKLADPDGVYSLTKGPEASKAAIETLKKELKGKVIGVLTATSLADFVNTYFDGVVEVRYYKSLPEAMLDMESDRIDGVFGSDAALAAITAQPKYSSYKMFGPKFIGGNINQGIAVGLGKDDAELKAKFDDAIAAASADGTIARLAKKWFTIDLTPLE